MEERAKPIRVLLQNPWVAPYRVPVYEAIRARPELDVSFVVGQPFYETDACDDLMSRGAHVTKLINRFPIRRKNLALLTLQDGLLPLVNRDRVDVMIASLDPRMVMNLFAFWKARRSGIPFIWWGHGIRPRGRYPRLYRALVNAAEATIFYDAVGKGRFVTMGVPEEKLFVAWNSVDTSRISTLRLPYVAEERNAIVYVGRLIVDKKVDLLIRGFAIASKTFPTLRLVIVGSGPEREALIALALTLGIADKTEFIPGTYDPTEVANHFNGALLHACGGYVGLSVIESLAYGVPVLAANGERHSPEVVALEDGINSRFFAANDPQSLADAIVESARNPSLLNQFSAACLAKVQGQFSCEAMAETFVNAVHYAAATHH